MIEVAYLLVSDVFISCPALTPVNSLVLFMRKFTEIHLSFLASGGFANFENS